MNRIARVSESFSFPALTMHLGIRQLPEIDHSQGAFIAVVVTLSVLIVVCCIAVFYLLRHHEPTEQDRAARRERYRRTREHAALSSNMGADASASAPTVTGLGSLGGKARRWWHNSGPGGIGQKGGGRRGRGRGWIRAGSDDEWATRSEDGGDAELGGGDHHPRVHTLPVLKPMRDAGDAEGGGGSGEGVRVVESPLSDSGSGFAHHGTYGDAYTHMYTDPFAKTVTGLHGGAALQPSQSPPLSSPASSSREYASVDEGHEAHAPGEDQDYRHRSTMSNGSAWTHAGSKFVEDI